MLVTLLRRGPRRDATVLSGHTQSVNEFCEKRIPIALDIGPRPVSGLSHNAEHTLQQARLFTHPLLARSEDQVGWEMNVNKRMKDS